MTATSAAASPALRAALREGRRGARRPVPGRLAFSNARDLCRAFALFNPHAAIRYNGDLVKGPVPVKRWSACERTSPHWYGAQHLRDLIAAHLARERAGLDAPRHLRELVNNFDGLSSNARTKAAGRSSATLSALPSRTHARMRRSNCARPACPQTCEAGSKPEIASQPTRSWDDAVARVAEDAAEDIP
jgi:hypothetical protein